jgi:hypothetical protein
MSDIGPISSENKSDEPTENTAPAPFGLEVSYPETVTIRMVDASALGDYEVIILLASFSCNAAVGFLVSAATIDDDRLMLGIVSVVFWLLTFGFVVWALNKRSMIKEKTKVRKIVGRSTPVVE